MKEIKVTYGKDTYSRNAMSGVALITFAATFQLKLSCLASSLFEVMTYRDGDSFSRHQCLKDILNPEEWMWLINELIFNKELPLAVNGKYLDETEVQEHFAGDALKLMSVTYEMAIQNLGEQSTFMENLTGSMKDIADSLKGLAKDYKENVRDSINLYVNNQASKKPKGKPKSK